MLRETNPRRRFLLGSRSRASAALLVLILANVPDCSAEITASLAGSDLIVMGDSDNDSILVRDNYAGGVVVIGRSGTLVNGTANGTFSSGMLPVSDIVIDTDSGADSVVLRVSNTTGFTDILTGTGDDYVAVLASGFSAQCKLLAQGGNDVAYIAKTEFASFVTNMGGGSDSIIVEQCSIAGKATLIAGNGSNLNPENAIVECIELLRSDVYGPTKLLTGNGPDTVIVEQSLLFGALTVTTNPGEDSVRLEQSRIEGISKVLLGNGDDRGISVNSEHVGDTTVSCSAGNDTVAKVGSEFVGNVYVNGGGGNDNILSFGARFGTSSADVLEIDGFFGNDFVFAFGNIFNSSLILDGNHGLDNLSGDGNLYGGSSTEMGFEGVAEPAWMALINDLLTITCTPAA